MLQWDLGLTHLLVNISMITLKGVKNTFFVYLVLIGLEIDLLYNESYVVSMVRYTEVRLYQTTEVCSITLFQ